MSELSGQSNIISKVEESGMASAAELKASNIWRQRLGQVIGSYKVIMACLGLHLLCVGYEFVVAMV